MTYKQIRIEKYDIEAFRKEQKPYAQILNEVIQRCPMKHSPEFLLWCFLESLPETWKPNKHHIMEYFSISERSYERYMGWLNAVGLIEYRQLRNKNGSFGKWELIVLNGTKFNPDAARSRSAKIGGVEVMRTKKEKVIHISPANRSAKIGGVEKSSEGRASIEESSISPFRQKTVERLNGEHINTTKIFTKERKKTNNTVSVFSETQFVKTHIEKVIASRAELMDFDDELIDQGIFYSFTKNTDKSFDSVNKRINIFLKKVRERKWLIPQGWNGISSKSMRDIEEQEKKAKHSLYKQEADAFKTISHAVLTPVANQSLTDILKKLRTG